MEANNLLGMDASCRVVEESTGEPFESSATKVPIESLPTELLVLIFSWLTTEDLSRSVSRVCQRWRECMHFKQIWCDKELVYTNQYEDDFIYVLNVAPCLKKMKINPLFCVDPSSVVKAIRQGPQNIESIQFNLSLFMFDAAARVLSHYKHNVCELHLVGYANKQTSIYRNLGPVLGQMSQLRSLKLSGYFDTKWDEKALENGSLKLQHLDVSFIQDESDSYLPLLNSVKSHLKTLKLPQFKSNVGVLGVVAGCTELKELTICLDDLRCVTTLTSLEALHIRWSEGGLKCRLSRFVRECPIFEILKELTLQYIPGSLAVDIAKRCHNLEILTMHGITSCTSIIRSTPTVQKLCILDRISLRMRHVQKLSNHLPNLRYLDLQGSFVNRGIPPKIISQLKAKLPGLKIVCDPFVKYSKSSRRIYLTKCTDSSTDCSSDEA